MKETALITNADFANMDSWTAEEFANRGRYWYDAEYHAHVHLVGLLCELVGRLRARVLGYSDTQTERSGR